MTLSDHRSRQHGSGTFPGPSRRQAGDRPSSIDWAQSTLTNFSPLIGREFEQPSTRRDGVVTPSTRCGASGVPIAATVARAIATIGLSATFFQDPFGLVTFDAGFERLATIRPRTGKSHLVHCVDAYQFQYGLQPVKRIGSVGDTLAGFLRGRALLPIISDFLFEDPEPLLHELALLNATHDVFLVLIDSAFAFDLPAISAGWIEAVDVETGRARTFSRRAFSQLADEAKRWQQSVQHAAKEAGLDVIEFGLDQAKSDIALSEFVAERRLRKTYS